VTGKFNARLRTFVSLSVIGASVAFGMTPAAAAVTSSQRSLNVLAHEDDDLLFMNPDIQHDLSAGVCVTTVFLTAGDDGQSRDYWLEREVGSQSAYDTMLGTPSTWTTSQRPFAGHSVRTTTSAGGTIDLINLRLPDGGVSGTGFPVTGNQSLSWLYSGSISSIQAIDGSATYSRNDLMATIAAIATAAGPSRVRVQDGRSDQGDHTDHQMGALFTLEALIGYTGTVTGYRGYGVVNDPANVSGNDLILKTNAVVSYAAHDTLLCSDLSNCPQGVAAEVLVGDSRTVWMCRGCPMADGQPGRDSTGVAHGSARRVIDVFYSHPAEERSPTAIEGESQAPGTAQAPLATSAIPSRRLRSTPAGQRAA